MTEGSISRKIILFAIPLFLGNLFQQLYNTADSLIVGNFLGSNALAAVSSSGNLIFLMVGFINGIAMGAGVGVARYDGAKIKDCLQKAIHTTCLLYTSMQNLSPSPHGDRFHKCDGTVTKGISPDPLRSTIPKT